MSIKPSAAAEIRSLVEALDAADDVRREAAIARLAIIGPRAVDRLLTACGAPEAPRTRRIAALRALEAIADPRAIPAARQALREGGDVAVAAASTLRALLDAPADGAAAASLDALVAAVLDRTLERRVRLAAFDALQDTPEDVRARVAQALEDDEDVAVCAHLADASRASATEAAWQDALDGRLPDDPGALRAAAQARASSAPLGSLQRLVDAVRAREQEEGGDPARAREWLALRGALHQALALRGSRIAVYDLRETLDAAADALPATFLTALHVVGDESCLEPIAHAYVRAEHHERWRHQLAAAFVAIVKRERIGRSSAALKRIPARWPGAAPLVSKTSRTTPRAKTRGRT